MSIQGLTKKTDTAEKTKNNIKHISDLCSIRYHFSNETLTVSCSFSGMLSLNGDRLREDMVLSHVPRYRTCSGSHLTPVILLFFTRVRCNYYTTSGPWKIQKDVCSSKMWQIYTNLKQCQMYPNVMNMILRPPKPWTQLTSMEWWTYITWNITWLQIYIYIYIIMYIYMCVYYI